MGRAPFSIRKVIQSHILTGLRYLVKVFDTINKYITFSKPLDTVRTPIRAQNKYYLLGEHLKIKHKKKQYLHDLRAHLTKVSKLSVHIHAFSKSS